MNLHIRAILADSGPPSHIQCAQNGIWEQALGKEGDFVLPGFEHFDRWYASATEFALEIFFRDKSDNTLFVGMRWINTGVDDIYALLSNVEHVVIQEKHTGNAVTTLEALASNFGISFFEDRVDFLELGVNNLWKSTGSCSFWKVGDRPPDDQSLRSRIARDAPQLLACQPNELMLEVAANLPLPHWLGLCVSKPYQGEHRLDFPLLHHAVVELHLDPE